MLDCNQYPLIDPVKQTVKQTSDMSPLLRFECKKLLGFHRFPQQKAKGDGPSFIGLVLLGKSENRTPYRGCQFFFISHLIKIGKP